MISTIAKACRKMPPCIRLWRYATDSFALVIRPRMSTMTTRPKAEQEIDHGNVGDLSSATPTAPQVHLKPTTLPNLAGGDGIHGLPPARMGMAANPRKLVEAADSGNPIHHTGEQPFDPLTEGGYLTYGTERMTARPISANRAGSSIPRSKLRMRTAAVCCDLPLPLGFEPILQTSSKTVCSSETSSGFKLCPILYPQPPLSLDRCWHRTRCQQLLCLEQNRTVRGSDALTH